jgi:uncharacterized protein involved in exopolysaccharide biosynthesis
VNDAFVIDQLRARLWAGRGWIIALVMGSTLIVGVIAYLLPPWYRADASLLPPTEEDNGFGIASLLKGFGVPGVKVATQTEPAEVFMAVVQSRRLGEEMVNRFDLKTRYKKKYMTDAIAELRHHSTFGITEAGTLQISVEDRDPQRAADMANAYVDILDHFNREVRMTKGRRTRMFVEQRLTETQKQLADAETKLAEYEAKHKAVALTPEMSSAIETQAESFAQRQALEVRLGVIRTYSKAQTDEEQQILQQLAQIDRQLEALPTTGLEIARMIRDVKTLEQLQVLLTAQYEEARINEVRDVPTVEPLDVATPPERKSRPRRTIMMAMAFVLSFGASATYAIFRSGPLVPDAGRKRD